MLEEEKLSRNQVQAIIDSQNRRVDESKKKKTVCVHWLVGRCKMEENCPFLHVMVEDKIPPCRYFIQDGVCSKGDKCVFRHVIPQEKRTEDCPYYERGFCRMGLFCTFNHIHKKICENYMYGFCPKGPDCEKEHIKSVIADNDTTLKILANFPDNENWADKSALQATHQQQQQPWQKAMNKVRCHRCGIVGHKSTYCQEEQITQEELNIILEQDDQYNMQNQTVLCFKCKRYGHYANVCPTKGMPASTAGGPDGQNRFGMLNPLLDNMGNQAPSAASGMDSNQPQDQLRGDHAMDGGNQNADLTQNLRNLVKLFDSQDSGDQQQQQQNGRANPTQTVTVSKVSVQDLPLQFEQIEMAVNFCAYNIQREGYMALQ